MMDLFRMEAEERLSALSQGLVALEGTGATAVTIEPLMRAAHSLKGAARVVGLDPAVRVAHAMEDCLVAAQKGQISLQAGHVDTLLGGVDLLEQISRVSEGELEAWQECMARRSRRWWPISPPSRGVEPQLLLAPSPVQPPNNHLRPNCSPNRHPSLLPPRS